MSAAHDRNQFTRSIRIASEATDRAFKVLEEVEAAIPPDHDLVRAACAALAIAEDVERTAYDRYANALLDTEGVRQMLEVLEHANDKLEETAKQLKAALVSLQDFTLMANVVAGILKAFRR